MPNAYLAANVGPRQRWHPGPGNAQSVYALGPELFAGLATILYRAQHMLIRVRIYRDR